FVSQAEHGILDRNVTGVQTCALPILKKLELPVPAFEIVHNGEECRKALESFSLPAVIKTCQGGYDGKGQLKIESVDDVEEAVDFAENAGVTCIIEEWVSFDKEI